MAEMIVVEDRNQDDMSRKAGCYVYLGTRLWFEDNVVHRADGPALIFPDGVEKWYLRGKDRTRDVKMLFMEQRWPLAKGLDTPEKLAAFQQRFADALSPVAGGVSG